MTDRNDDARLSLVLVAVALVTVGATASVVAPDLGIDRPAIVEPPSANGPDDGANATDGAGPDGASDRALVDGFEGGDDATIRGAPFADDVDGAVDERR